MFNKMRTYISKIGELPGCILKGGLAVSFSSLCSAMIITFHSMPMSFKSYKNLFIAENLFAMSLIVAAETIAAALFIDKYSKMYIE